nr:acyl carrier protein [uncultured Acetatifactor sp.]
MEQLFELLEEIRPDVDFRTLEGLVTGSYIDSFDIVSIINAVEDEYGIEIPVESMLPENFESAAAIMNLVDSLR